MNNIKYYRTTNSITCMLCETEFSSNKNGSFTSHLNKQHQLTLNQYLKQYFYEEKSLICNSKDCNNLVDINDRKSINKFEPKDHCAVCSEEMKRKPRERKCIECGDLFNKEDLRVKTCSAICASSIKSRKVKKWHESMTPYEKEIHFNNIIAKTTKTRRENNTPSWNSGKTGIYSEETIDKIRQATLRQMANHKFSKTSIEVIIEDLLKDLNLDYTYSFILKNRQYDFLLKDYNLIIECDGDYWHANPKFYPNPLDWQKDRIEIDKNKDEIVIGNGYTIIRFWEDDIVNNFGLVKSELLNLLTTTQLETISVNV